MQQELEILLGAGTAVIADIFDSLELLPLVLDNSVRPIATAASGFAGPAFTVTGETHHWSGNDYAKLAAIDAMPPGVVALWAGTDVKGACLFGDLLGNAMRSRGCLGAVVDGGVRDLAYLRNCGLPIFARYASPAQGIGRWQVTGHQLPVRVRGALEDWISIEPGDILVADEDGVVAIPQRLLEAVLARVTKLTDHERTVRDEIRQGLPLLMALEKYGRL